MNAAAAAKTGRQRAASHNSGANSTATGHIRQQLRPQENGKSTHQG